MQTPQVVHVTTVPMSLRFLRGQLQYMKKRGLDISVVSSPDSELEQFSQSEGVPAKGISMTRSISPFADLQSLWELWNHFRQINPQIVHSHTPKGGLLGMISATLARVPKRCYHMRGLPMMSASGARRELLRWTERISCTLADEVYCVSNSLRDVALQEKLCDPNKIRVLAGGSGNGVDSAEQYNPENVNPEKTEQLQKELNIPKEVPVLGFVGRLVRDKGVVELEKAWRSIKNRYPTAILLLIGPEESGDALPENCLNALKNDPQVRMLGMQPSAAPYYPLMDLLILPTYREGFPNVLLEAAAMELPVVATEVPGCIDAVIPEQTGKLVPPQNSQALEAAIDAYLGDPKQGKLHGKEARYRVTKHFAQEAIWAAIYSRYQGLLGLQENEGV